MRRYDRWPGPVTTPALPHYWSSRALMAAQPCPGPDKISLKYSNFSPHGHQGNNKLYNWVNSWCSIQPTPFLILPPTFFKYLPLMHHLFSFFCNNWCLNSMLCKGWQCKNLNQLADFLIPESMKLQWYDRPYIRQLQSKCHFYTFLISSFLF